MLLGFFISFFMVSSLSFADLVVEKVNDKILNVDTTVEIPPLWDLEYISTKFCDQWKVVDKEELMMRPWQTKDVCIVFFNKATTGSDISIIANFSQGTLQDNWVPNCSDVYSSGVFFGLLSKFKSWDFTMALAPWEQSVKHIRVSIPKDMTWDNDIYGCIVYQLNKKKPENFSWMFYVVNAKASYIHVQTTWAVYTRESSDAIKFFWQDNKMLILKTMTWILGILLIYYLALSFRDKKSSKHNNKK